jgi:hypothetical protein
MFRPTMLIERDGRVNEEIADDIAAGRRPATRTAESGAAASAGV